MYTTLCLLGTLLLLAHTGAAAASCAANVSAEAQVAIDSLTGAGPLVADARVEAALLCCDYCKAPAGATTDAVCLALRELVRLCPARGLLQPLTRPCPKPSCPGCPGGPRAGECGVDLEAEAQLCINGLTGVGSAVADARIQAAVLCCGYCAFPGAAPGGPVCALLRDIVRLCPVRKLLSPLLKPCPKLQPAAEPAEPAAGTAPTHHLPQLAPGGGNLYFEVYLNRPSFIDYTAAKPDIVRCFPDVNSGTCPYTTPASRTNYRPLSGTANAATPVALPSNATLEGAPCDAVWQQTQAHWGLGLENNYNIRWRGKIQFPVAGTYNLMVLTNDGIRVDINGTRVLAVEVVQPLTQNTASFTISDADTVLSFETNWFQGPPGSACVFYWNYHDGAINASRDAAGNYLGWVPVPPSAFLPSVIPGP